uniref:Uncharacterized protein n=1 Tax=Rhizophora mucronata TaxID=61149 RepID=A0A2P2Q958_RHIMU
METSKFPEFSSFQLLVLGRCSHGLVSLCAFVFWGLSFCVLVCLLRKREKSEDNAQLYR